MERAALLSGGEMVLPEHLPARVRSVAPGAQGGAVVRGQKLEELERQAILQALKQCNYNRTETARTLGISRRALLYKLQNLRELGFGVHANG
jgi:DNA-binding NtrC family response regulator